MLRVTIVCVGKLKEAYWRQAVAEYEKRLGAFCDLRIVELTEERLPDKPGAAQIRTALAAEAGRIEPYLTGRRVYPLCIEGRPLSSEDLADRMRAAMADGAPVVFIVGSSHGLDERVKRAATEQLSFSAMTFPHQLARVMLLEQLYRAFSIASGGKYHK